jgi:hypothetical protein
LAKGSFWKKRSFQIGAGLAIGASIGLFIYNNNYIRNGLRKPGQILSVPFKGQKPLNDTITLIDTLTGSREKDTAISKSGADSDAAQLTGNADTAEKTRLDNEKNAVADDDENAENDRQATEIPPESIEPINDSIRHDKQVKDTFTIVRVVNSINEPIGGENITENKKLNSAQVKKQAKTLQQAIHLEFWVSPINFKGYRFFKNNLQLYGLNSKVNLQVINYDGNFYLKAFNRFFGLEEQNDYNPFIQVRNRETIDKLRQ